LSEIDLVGQYSKCRALIFPGEEDFGIVPVEAHAAGRPVIAYAAGGALETNIDGVTGVFFKEKNAESLIDAVQRFVDMEKVFDSQTIRSKALNYEKRIFKETIRNYVEMKYCEYFSRCKL
jgi:glycosyltransferase involved in cell wall biosynthesis